MLSATGCKKQFKTLKMRNVRAPARRKSGTKWVGMMRKIFSAGANYLSKACEIMIMLSRIPLERQVLLKPVKLWC